MAAASDSSEAIVIRNVSKQFRKSTIARHHTTLKSELIRLLRGDKRKTPSEFIQSLHDVSLKVTRGRTLAIVGRNGAGKSTLLKLITGIYRPTSGSIEVNGRISALLDLGAGFHPEFSGRENILINGIILGMSRSEIRGRMEQIIEFSELGEFIDEPVRTYSSGMYMRLAFSVATHVDPDILVIDEILAVGDEHFSRKSRAKMNEFKQAGKTILLVTHDLATVERWCDEAAWLDQGRIRLTGEPQRVVKEYRDAVALAESQAGGAPSHLPISGLAAALPAESTSARRDQQPSAEPRSPAPRGASLARVRLLDHADREVSTLDPEDCLNISLDFTNPEEVLDFGFALSISRKDGVHVCALDTWLEDIQPLASPPKAGTVRLTLERIGLAAGEYVVDAAIRSKSGTSYDSHQGSCFTIQSPAQGAGIIQPPHRWSFESAQVSATIPADPAQSQPEHSSDPI